MEKIPASVAGQISEGRMSTKVLGHVVTHVAAAAAKSLQSCPTLCDSTDGSPPGSPVPGILQARTLEWVAIAFSESLMADPQPMGFPGGSSGKNPPVNAGGLRDVGSIPGLRRSPREGNGDPLQCSCLENPRDRGTWWATVLGVAKSQTRLSH